MLAFMLYQKGRIGEDKNTCLKLDLQNKLIHVPLKQLELGRGQKFTYTKAKTIQDSFNPICHPIWTEIYMTYM